MTKTKQAKETQNRLPIHEVMETVLQNAGIPKEIAANIVDTQKHMEEIDQTKRSIRILRAIHTANKETYQWCLNVFWDMEVHVRVLATNSQFLNEPWFKENWKFLFRELLCDIENHFDMYVRSRMQKEGGFDEFAQGQMTLIKKNMIDPLKRMKRKCDRFRPTWY